jgi:hypothetical protein
VNKSLVGLLFLIFAGCFLLIPFPLVAQSALEPRTAEITGVVGASFGLNSVSDAFRDAFAIDLPGGQTLRFDPGTNTKWNYGLSGGFTVIPRLMVTGEILQTQIADPKLELTIPPVTTTINTDLSLMELTGGVQYEIPVTFTKVFPYVAGSLGWARSHIGLNASAFGLDLKNSENDFTANYGGGARVYFSPRWGFRPEFKVVHVPDETFVRATIGVFFQFGK